VQELGGRAAAVGLRVRGIRELVGQEGVVARGHPPRGVDGLVHPAQRLDDLDARAVEPQERLALAAHALREEDRQVVALGGAAERERDPGVAGRGLHDRRAARLDATFALGRLDHRHADPVLDRPAGIERLELGVELDVDVAGHDPRESDHRGTAHVLGDVDRNTAHCVPTAP
jgi:hypothetical protein